MTYLVDTDWIVDYLTGLKIADDLFAALLPSGIAISIVSFSEIYEGIYGSRDPNWSLEPQSSDHSYVR